MALREHGERGDLAKFRGLERWIGPGLRMLCWIADEASSPLSHQADYEQPYLVP